MREPGRPIPEGGLSDPSDESKRARLTRAMAHLGLGRLARKVLGRRLAAGMRDWVRWGVRPARKRPPVPMGRLPLRHWPSGAVRGPLGANVVGYVSSESGVGEKARSTIRSLQAADVPVAATELDPHRAHRMQDLSCAGMPEGNPHPFNVLAVNADVTPQVLSELGRGFFERKFNIGYWSWELEQFPEEWADRFDRMDEVWVPSSFCQDAISRVSPVPVLRIPHSVRVADMRDEDWGRLGVPAGRFVFLFVYDYHSFAERKNPLGLVRAFRSAFGDRDDVHLVLKGTDGRIDPEYHARLEREGDLPNVTLLTGYLDKPVLNGLMKRCNCYVSLHRCEGFGLTMAEAMYLAKPVIATAYSGNMDFMRPGNSYGVRYELVEIEQDHGPYRKGCVWAEPDLDHAAELMLKVVEDRQEASRTAARGAAEIHRHFSDAAVGRRIRERLDLLLGDGPLASPGDLAPKEPEPVAQAPAVKLERGGGGELLADLTENWDGLAASDPLWAILSHPGKRGGRWKLDEFFRTGEETVVGFINYVESLGIELRRGSVLDFGCGVGRLTQGLGEHFERAVGIDLSPRMIHLAQQHNRRPEKVAYVVSRSPGLPFRAGAFDLVCTQLVLQHVRPELALGYMGEFVRVLRRGGVALFDALFSCSATGDSQLARTPVETEQGTLVVEMNAVRVERVFDVVRASGAVVAGMSHYLLPENIGSGYLYCVRKL